MKDSPIILHIDLGNQSVSKWLEQNRYIIFSELVRYTERLIKENLNTIQAIMVSNLSDNIVFIIKKESAKLTLDKSMEYFLSIEEYEQCAKIRDLYILIENLKNETKDIKISKSNQRGLKGNR
jgi:hypothetical protein